MLNFDRDTLLLVKSAMEECKRWYQITAKDPRMELTKQRAINDVIRCNRIIDAIDKELVSLEDAKDGYDFI